MHTLQRVQRKFSHLSPSITPGNHHWKGAAPLFDRRGVQMIIDVHEFLSNVNKSSVNVFITTINRSIIRNSLLGVMCRLGCISPFTVGILKHTANVPHMGNKWCNFGCGQ
jgi:hypothetical protein